MQRASRSSFLVALGVVSLAGAAFGVVGNEIALTESAEASELAGNFTKAATARQRAIQYAERNLRSLESAGNSTKVQRDLKLTRSVIAENKRWLAEDQAGGGKLSVLKEEMKYVSDVLAGLKAAEGAYQRAKRARQNAAAAKRTALDLYAAKMADLKAKIADRDAAVRERRQGYQDRELEATYMRGVLIRWEWAHAELRDAD